MNRFENTATALFFGLTTVAGTSMIFDGVREMSTIKSVCEGNVLPDNVADYGKLPETVPALARICKSTNACVAQSVYRLYEAGAPINGAIAADARRQNWGECKK